MKNVKRQNSEFKYIFVLELHKSGFTIVFKIEDMRKVNNYITKYITKELISAIKGKHRYLYSKKLEVQLLKMSWCIIKNYL